MQAHYDMQWPDDGLHMTNGSALAAGSTWELEPDSEPDFELASSDMRSIKSSSASQGIPQRGAFSKYVENRVCFQNCLK